MSKVICNKCGKEFDMWDESESNYIHKKLGYGSRFDGDDLKLHLCCSCLDDIIDSCVVTPIVESDIYTPFDSDKGVLFD